jgi:hypothetical protein
LSISHINLSLDLSGYTPANSSVDSHRANGRTIFKCQFIDTLTGLKSRFSR